MLFAMVAVKRTHRVIRVVLASAVGLLASSLLAACDGAAAARGDGRLFVVAAENEYGNVAAQIGGRYVTVDSIEKNPDTDPHEYEVSPSVAGDIASSDLAIQNGVGYDAFMDKLESAAPSDTRTVLDVQHLLGLPDDTPNPHLWYRPTTMVKVATALARDLAKLRPRHTAYFLQNARRFVASLRPWWHAIYAFRTAYGGTPVATTEPVADYLLKAAGTKNLTPWALQAAIMNGIDPAPEDVSMQFSLIKGHKVKVFLYNEQVTDSLTASFLAAAHKAGVPTVAVYETMPPGLDYQSWMLAETRALAAAVTSGRSTATL